MLCKQKRRKTGATAAGLSGRGYNGPRYIIVFDILTPNTVLVSWVQKARFKNYLSLLNLGYE